MVSYKCSIVILSHVAALCNRGSMRADVDRTLRHKRYKRGVRQHIHAGRLSGGLRRQHKLQRGWLEAEQFTRSTLLPTRSLVRQQKQRNGARNHPLRPHQMRYEVFRNGMERFQIGVVSRQRVGHGVQLCPQVPPASPVGHRGQQLYVYAVKTAYSIIL